MTFSIIGYYATSSVVVMSTVASDAYIYPVGFRCSYHYDIPGIENVWGYGNTAAEANADLDRKIARIRRSLEMVW